ncbi:MAG: protein kinase [Planctomycetes bacterium]|nr:protein kinase [Planctomycetota bacterium]
MADTTQDAKDPVTEILDSVLAGPSARWEEEVEAACAAHPDLAARLRRRFATMREHGLLPTEDETGAGAGMALPERLGEFRLLRRLGGGGMGVVYLAHQEGLRRDVAIKLIRPELAFFENSTDRFRREAEHLARLRHPGIVPVHTVGEAGGVPYLVMEHVDGISLADLIDAQRSRRPQSLRAQDLEAAFAARAGGTGQAPSGLAALGRSWCEIASRIALQAAQALDHAHGQGVVHRDVKPSNIMLARDGRVLLLDFGLALAEGASRITRTGAHLGSLPYSAPEQVQGGGRAVDRRSDVFSLGVVLYELLALAQPFAGATTQETAQRILTGEPPDLRRRNPGVGPDLVAIVAKALEKDPRRRYPDMGALAADLEALLEFRPVQARRQTRWVRLVRWVRREPLRAALAGVLLVGVPGVAVLAGFLLANRGTYEAGAARLREETLERHLGRGFLELGGPDADRARAEFESALALRPDDADARLGLELAALRARAGGAGRIPGMAGLESLPDPAGDSPQALFRRALVALWASGRDDAEAPRRARALLSDAILRTPHARALHYFQLAEAAARCGERGEIERVCAAIESLWPDSAVAWASAGSAWLACDAARAETALRRALAITHDLVRAQGDLATSLLLQGRAGEAEAAFVRALELAPRNAIARMNLGTLLLQQGRAADAVAHLRRAVADSPALPGAHYNLGVALAGVGERGAALAAFERTVELAPDYQPAWQNVAELLLQAGRHQDVAARMRTALTHIPRWAHGHAYLARALQELGDPRAALEPLRRYVELVPTDAETAAALKALQEKLR